jgi:hypothetical protein
MGRYESALERLEHAVKLGTLPDKGEKLIPIIAKLREKLKGG